MENTDKEPGFFPTQKHHTSLRILFGTKINVTSSKNYYHFKAFLAHCKGIPLLNHHFWVTSAGWSLSSQIQIPETFRNVIKLTFFLSIHIQNTQFQWPVFSLVSWGFTKKNMVNFSGVGLWITNFTNTYILVGGFNPSEQKYVSNWESAPNRDQYKKCFKPPASITPRPSWSQTF